MSGLIETLKQVTEYIHSDTERELTHWTGEYDGSYHYSAVLKIQWDLLQCIERRLLIRMQYMVQDGKGRRTGSDTVADVFWGISFPTEGNPGRKECGGEGL